MRTRVLKQFAYGLSIIFTVVLVLQITFGLNNNEDLLKPILHNEPVGGLLIKLNKKNQLNSNVFDLNQPLTDEYKPIQCRLSKEILKVVTTLCIHDLKKDSYVSSAIWNNGVWEEDIVTTVLQYLINNPDCIFLDIGAQIGEYSLYAAKLGRKVLTVEPFYDNIIRIHKAAKSENLGNQITLVTNAISNVRGEIKLLKQESNNIGGQSLVQNKNKAFTKNDIKPNDPNAKYFVETILFDDIVDFLPLNDDGKHFKKAVLKIDIEAFEPYAFLNAEKLFNELEIPIVFMEWGNLPAQVDMQNEIEKMISFFEERDFTAYYQGAKLNRTNWKTGWGWDIIWRKAGY